VSQRSTVCAPAPRVLTERQVPRFSGRPCCRTVGSRPPALARNRGFRDECRPMAILEPAGPNAEQIRYWNETAGPKWIAFQKLLDAQLGPLGRRTMDRAEIAAGDRVLDVGCGCGDTTLELARRVGPKGLVVGVDV